MICKLFSTFAISFVKLTYDDNLIFSWSLLGELHVIVIPQVIVVSSENYSQKKKSRKFRSINFRAVSAPQLLHLVIVFCGIIPIKLFSSNVILRNIVLKTFIWIFLKQILNFLNRLPSKCTLSFSNYKSPTISITKLPSLTSLSILFTRTSTWATWVL